MNPRAWCLLLFFTFSLQAEISPVWIAGSGGLYHAKFDSAEGSLTAPQLAAEYGSGSWLVFHPHHPLIYSSWQTPKQAGVIVLKVATDGTVEILDRLTLPVSAPTHVALSPNGEMLATVQYVSKAFTLVSLQADGTFAKLEQVATQEGSGPRPVQKQSRPHWVGFSDDGRFLHVTDLGADEVWSYTVSPAPKPTLTLRGKTPFPAGSGPRHLAFSNDRRFAYVSDELSHHVTVLAYHAAEGEFTPIQHIDAAPADLDELTNNVSEIRVHPTGRFVYTGNRGHDSIAVFSVDPDSGRMTAVEREPSRGVWPRNFDFSPDGKWMLVAGQVSGTVAVFAIDQETGALRYNRQIINVPNPVRVLLGE